MPFVQLLLTGCVLGLAGYLVSCWRRRRPPELAHVFESGGWGAGVVAGLHLAWCAFSPSHLVHVLTSDHQPIEGVATVPVIQPMIVEMGEIHRVHIFAAGVATAYLAIMYLVGVCRETKSNESHRS